MHTTETQSVEDHCKTVIDILRYQHHGKWVGLHMILMNFTEDEYEDVVAALQTLHDAEIIEQKREVIYHNIVPAPTGVGLLFRYSEKLPPILSTVK